MAHGWVYWKWNRPRSYHFCRYTPTFPHRLHRRQWTLYDRNAPAQRLQALLTVQRRSTCLWPSPSASPMERRRSSTVWLLAAHRPSAGAGRAQRRITVRTVCLVAHSSERIGHSRKVFSRKGSGRTPSSPLWIYRGQAPEDVRYLQVADRRYSFRTPSVLLAPHRAQDRHHVLVPDLPVTPAQYHARHQRRLQSKGCDQTFMHKLSSSAMPRLRRPLWRCLI